jgi:hypothetical protein
LRYDRPALCAEARLVAEEATPSSAVAMISFVLIDMVILLGLILTVCTVAAIPR